MSMAASSGAPIARTRPGKDTPLPDDIRSASGHSRLRAVHRADGEASRTVQNPRVVTESSFVDSPVAHSVSVVSAALIEAVPAVE
jgi:hypothetical protein